MKMRQAVCLQEAKLADDGTRQVKERSTMNKLVTLRNQTLRRSVILAGVAGSTLVVGCAQFVTTEQRELAPEPELTLQFEGAATQPVRDFDRTTGVYANGDIVTGSTGARYTTRDDTNVYLLPFAETGVFLANVVTSPVTFYQQRDGVLSTGPQFPPTHTAMPVLPPSLAQQQQNQQNPNPEPRPMNPEAQPSDVQQPTPEGQPAQVEPLPPQGSAPSVATPENIVPPQLPAVTLTPAAELSTNAFAVVGSVASPGRYEAQENLTLAQAVLAAGVAGEDQSKVIVKIERAGEEPSSATLAEIVSGQTANPTIVAGDVLTVTVNQ